MRMLQAVGEYGWVTQISIFQQHQTAAIFIGQLPKNWKRLCFAFGKYPWRLSECVAILYMTAKHTF